MVKFLLLFDLFRQFTIERDYISSRFVWKFDIYSFDDEVRMDGEGRGEPRQATFFAKIQEDIPEGEEVRDEEFGTH